MKKNGFTLAEVLIALGIIGIISAIIIPTVNNSKPDKTKMLYLNAYDSLTNASSELARSSSLYSSMYISDKGRERTATQCTYSSQQTTICEYQFYNTEYNIEKYPLLDFSKPVDTNFNDASYSGNYKYANLLREVLNGNGTSCTSGSSCSFTTKNGIEWTVIPSPVSQTLDSSTKTLTTVKFYNIITTNINGENFNFYVLADGSVVPTDIKGQAYLKYRTSPRLKDGYTTGLSEITLNDSKLSHHELTVGTDIKLVNQTEGEVANVTSGGHDQEAHRGVDDSPKN